MNDYFFLSLGILCAVIGGELFVRGAVGLGYWARISPGVIGATFAAFATSSPELSVSINSALAGSPKIALGDALGSNVVNIALVLGAALAVSGIQCPRDSVKRDFPLALFIPVITGLLCLDGELSRLDGLAMLTVFFLWLTATAVAARKQRGAAEEPHHDQQGWKILLTCILGLGFLIAAGNFIVTGAKGIAVSFGIDEFIIGATIVAVGTSAPELATTIIAKLRGHDEIGLGTILGSNIFNGIFIVAIAASIHPIRIAWNEVAIALAFGLTAVALTYPPSNGFITRKRGVLLLSLYAVYLAMVFQGKVS
ncbi:MAG: sodium:calcium antiporter [Burkholderiales bacterium]|nr:sodium:calcium antiporter [Burkholderiales bacterium]